VWLQNSNFVDSNPVRNGSAAGDSAIKAGSGGIFDNIVENLLPFIPQKQPMTAIRSTDPEKSVY
jgi:hypothetical protein